MSALVPPDGRIGEYIRVCEKPRPAGRKTAIWTICDRYWTPLAEVRWYGRWRQYTLWPAGDTVWSTGCLQDAVRFIARCNAVHRAAARSDRA
jgi:hypothetical protein